MIETNFKHTDIGLIPHDWEVKSLDSLFAFYAGGDIQKEYFSMTPQENKRYPIYSNSLENKGLYGYTSNPRYEANSITITGRGSLGHAEFRNHKFDAIVRLLVLQPKELISGEFITNTINFYMPFVFESTGVPQLTVPQTAKALIPLPPTLSEQEKIANALSKIDQLINDLGALIEKKKAIKQGTMQDLLTAKRRLKGFTGEWNSVKLGDLLEYRQPTKYLVSSKEYTTQGVPVLTAGKTFILGYTQENWGLYDDLPVIIFDDFVVESKYVTMPFKVKSSAIKMLSLKEKENDLRFIFEKMQCIEFSIADHKRHWISEYSQLEITIPEPNEQRAIANILSSMDTEITNLEQKRDKYIAIKQGMMQNLLTGKIRLI